MTLWPNGESIRLPTDGLLVQNQGVTLKSPINWTPFQIEFTEQQKVRTNNLTKRRLIFNLFLCFKI